MWDLCLFDCRACCELNWEEEMVKEGGRGGASGSHLVRSQTDVFLVRLGLL